jgi:hypothetical protein
VRRGAGGLTAINRRLTGGFDVDDDDGDAPPGRSRSRRAGGRHPDRGRRPSGDEPVESGGVHGVTIDEAPSRSSGRRRGAEASPRPGEAGFTRRCGPPPGAASAAAASSAVAAAAKSPTTRAAALALDAVEPQRPKPRRGGRAPKPVGDRRGRCGNQREGRLRGEAPSPRT